MIRIKKMVFIISALWMTLASLFVIQPVYADSHCRSLSGRSVPGKPSNHQYTGERCRILAPDYLLDCISAGNRYWVYYCATDCQARYDESSAAAPALCRRPAGAFSAIGDIFGKIQAPIPIQQLGFGALGISTFLTNLVALIYSLAIVVLIFMVLWGAWDWMTSEGDKEKLEGAKKKLVNAFIGIILFAIAFAAIRILGTFTGFKFFVGQ